MCDPQFCPKNNDDMKTDKKKSLLAHSCAAISIGLMAWVAGTVAISIFQMMESVRTPEKEKETGKG